jgi:hypothetical protein
MPRDVNLILADMDLCSLDVAARGSKETPIVLEVSKAVTVAQLHRDIEARVVCHSISDGLNAVAILSGPKFLASVGGHWDKDALEMTLPNGSAVVVKLP